jgi:hypothetical protein
MGTAYNPSITNSGLILCVDAGNPRSYPGSGTTINDISGQGNNGTLTNSPSYNAGNGGYLTFTSASSTYVSIPYSASLDTPTGCTHEIWFYPTGVGEFFSRGTSDSGATPDNPRLYVSATGSVYFDWSSPAADRYGDIAGAATMNAWNQVVLQTLPSTTMKLYTNGVYKGASSIGGNMPATIPNTANPIILGGATWIPRYFSGRIAIVRMYNRALSDDEILKNYNAVRGRFGL